jgi:hypothetical protein
VSYFEEDIPRRPEIVSGLFREGQIITFAGPFNVGKTPLLADLAVHVASGTKWCGREVVKRPVIHFDFESSDPDFRRTYRNIANRLGINLKVPKDIAPFLLNSTIEDPRTKALLNVKNSATMVKLLDALLTKAPDSLILFDPVEMAFPIDVLKKASVLALYRLLRELLGKFPRSAVLNTHNLRKDMRRPGPQPDLMLNPHDWLQEVAGSLDLINRSDVRLGVNRHSDNVVVVNGARRGEDMFPMLLAPVDDDPDELAGFKPIASSKQDLHELLSHAQIGYWKELPEKFRFIDHANNGIPKSSLSRLIKRCSSLGLLTTDGSWFTKIPLK